MLRSNYKLLYTQNQANFDFREEKLKNLIFDLFIESFLFIGIRRIGIFVGVCASLAVAAGAKSSSRSEEAAAAGGGFPPAAETFCSRGDLSRNLLFHP